MNKFDPDLIRVVGFDLDQTLYPKSDKIDLAIQKEIYVIASKKLGLPLGEVKKRFKELYRGGRGLSGGSALKHLGLEDGSEIVQTALENANIEEFLEPNPELYTLLEQLRLRGYGIDIITGSNLNNTVRKLKKLSLGFNLFNHIITSDDASKSNGDAYKLWMGLYSILLPRNFLYVGDRVQSDFIVPSSLGISSVLVNLKEFDNSLGCLQLPNILTLGDYLPGQNVS